MIHQLKKKFSKGNQSKEETILEGYSHKPKKSLGQNFLKSKKALSKICEAGNLSPGDVVLEIGPGKGVLTEKLISLGAKVVAVEKDDLLIEFLKEKFQNAIKNKKLMLIHEDILDFEIPQNIKKYKIIANIPYNITGAILKKFLGGQTQPSDMVLLVQKEVAERIVARDEKESILSISVKAYGIPKYIMTVNKRFFSPSPKVDSAIIQISSISKKNFSSKKFEGLFFETLKAGFAHKRKFVFSNIVKNFNQKEKLSNIFKSLDIHMSTRAENLNVKNWIEITKRLLF
jgi:16S rRNA (adenine1518-N6/adenine1519-N6)-dimethyltransferase